MRVCKRRAHDVAGDAQLVDGVDPVGEQGGVSARGRGDEHSVIDRHALQCRWRRPRGICNRRIEVTFSYSDIE